MAVNKCIKYLMFIFNFVFWLCGCIILAAAIYLRVNTGGNSITNQSMSGINLMIAIGVIIMVLGFLGCCGAMRENRCMLLLFFISLLLIFILLVAAGILGSVYKKQMNQQVNIYLETLTPLQNQPPAVQSDFGQLQTSLKCCGLNGPQDWGSTVPQTCNCTDTTKVCKLVSGQMVYSTGCAVYIVSLLETSMAIVLGISFAIAIVLIFGMAFSMTLYRQIGKVNVLSTA